MAASECAWLHPAAAGGDHIVRAFWWAAGEFHAKFASGTIVALSPTARTATISDAAVEAASATRHANGVESSTRRYITALCTIRDDMQLLATALRMRNAFSLAPPFICETLLPEGTPLLRIAGANEDFENPTANIPEFVGSGRVNWAGCTVDETTRRVVTLDGAASVTLDTTARLFTVEYPARVRHPNTDPSCLRYSPENPVRMAAMLAPNGSSSSSGGARTDNPLASAWVMHRVHYSLDDAPAVAAWRYPLARLLNEDTASVPTTQALPEAPTLLGNIAEAYPELLPAQGGGSFYNALNLFREAAEVPRTPARTGNASAFERGVGIVANRDAAAAWILHDMTLLTRGAPGGHFTHNGRDCFIADRTVRIEEPSPVTGGRTYHLRDAMQYLEGIPVVEESGALLSPRGGPCAAGGTAKASHVHRRFSIDGVGEATILGNRYSLRFHDRCIFRMRDGDPTATLLLPTGETTEVRLDSYAIPDALQPYCEAALAVFEQIPLMHA